MPPSGISCKLRREMPFAAGSKRERADETHAFAIRRRRAGAFHLKDLGDLGARLLDRLLDTRMEGELRRRASVTRACEANFDRRRMHTREFDVAAVRGEHRADALERRFDPFCQAWLEMPCRRKTA